MEEENQDTRWKQRLANFSKALKQLERFLEQGELNELETQGLIKVFEYCYELAWKTLQDLFQEKGFQHIIGPKPVVEAAFRHGYIEDGKAWGRMHRSRNLTSHTYDEGTANAIAREIKDEYAGLLKQLHNALEEEALHAE